MANKKIQATATLFLDTKDAQNDAKKFVNDLKQKLSEVETAADKMTVFKDMVAYIAQVDRALAALRAKNGAAFNSMFDGLDTNLKKQFQELFGVDDGKLEQLDILREKLATLTPKSSMGEIRELAGAIKDLYNSVGKKPPTLEFLDGSSQKAKTAYIQTLTDAVGDFATVWNDVNARISQGFGGTGSPKSGVLGGFSKEVQEEIDKLKQQKQDLQETLNSLNGIPLKINIDGKDSIAELDKLINEYSRLQKIMNSTEYRDMSGIYKDKAERDKINAERIRVASLIQAMNDHMVDVGNEDEAAFATMHYQEINDAISYYDNFLDLTKDQTHEIRQLYENLISDINIQLSQTKIEGFNLEPTKDSISEALHLLEEANQIMGQMSYEDPNFDLIEKQIDSLANKIKSLAKTEEQVGQIEDIWDKYSDSPNDMLDELCSVLSVNIPESAKKAENAIDDVLSEKSSSEDTNKSIELLKQQLQTVHDAGKNIGDHELGFVVDVDGATYFIESCENIVKASDEAAVAVRALNENMTIMGHTHPDGGGQFSAGDYTSMINQRRAGIISPSMVMGDKYASILNLADATDDVLTQIENILRRHGKSGDDAVGANIISEMQEIFSANGMPDALQIIKVADGMDELATSLYNMGSAANTAQSPLQKLQSLIKYYSGNKLGSDNLPEFNDYWNDFESGAKSAAVVFDEVMSKLGATDLEGNPFDTNSKQYQALGAALKLINTEVGNTSAQVDKSKTALKEFFELQDKIGSIDYYDIDDVGIGRYTERLEVAKKELDELGAQGLITADELKQVEEAYNISKSRLELETRNYTGHGDGYYDYTYYDDYKQEQSKNGDLENELARKEEQIAKLESDLRASDDALQETLGNKYALIAESRTLEIERAKLLLQKQNLEYEDILALMQSYQNLQAKAKEAFDYGDEKAMYDMQDIAGQIYDRVVPQNLDDFTEPDRWFKAVGMSAEEGAQKLLEFRERLEAIRSSHDDLELSDSEDIDDIQRENGALEDRLELLREIADAYGVQITQRDRNTYERLVDKDNESGLSSKDEDRMSELSDKIDEADNNLLEFEQTYERIVLKLSNGKKLEILPNDKGLRDLYEIADSYGTEYKGFEIEDIEFVRQEQFLKTKIESYEELCQVVERYNELIFKGSSRTSKEKLELDALQERIDATKGYRTPEQAIDDSIVWSRMVGPLGDLRSEKLAAYLGIEIPSAAGRAADAISDAAGSVQLFEKFDGQIGLFDDVAEGARKADAEVEDLKDSIQQISVLDGQIGFDDYVSHHDDGQRKAEIDVESGYTQSEIAQLDALQSKLLEVKTAVDAKTQAFEEEYVTVDSVVDTEIASLNKLKNLLVEIQGILQTVFSIGGMNLGEIELSQGKEDINPASTAIQGIQQTLQQILAVLQGFTGLEADGKNSITHKESTAKAPANNANTIEHFTSKLNDLATEGTLLKIPVAIENLADAIANKTKAKSDTHVNTINALDALISALNSNIKSLQDVMSGVTQHQKVQKTNTSMAMAKIADRDNYKQISDIAIGSVSSLGTEVQIKGMKALADGVVKVEGAFKNAKNEWEGFTVNVNDSNQAVDLAVNKHSTFAKALNETAEKAGEVAQEVKKVQDAPVEDAFTKAIYNQKQAFDEYRNNLQDVDYLTEALRKELDELGVSLQLVGDQSGLDVWGKGFADFKDNIKTVKSVFDQENTGKINLYQRELTNSFNKLTLPQREDMFAEYSEAIILLNKQKQAVKDGHAVELAGIKQITAALQEKINVQLESNKVAKDAETAQKKNSKFGDTAARNATAKYNSLIGTANSDQFANSKEVAAITAEYEKAYKAMITLRNELRNSDGAISEADEAEFKRLTTECNEYAKALDKLIKSTMKLKGNKANPNDYMLGSDFVDDAQGRKQALTDFVKSVYDIDVAAEDFKKDWNEVVFAVDNGDGTFTQMTATFTAARNEIVALAGDTNKVQGKFESFVDGVKNRLQSLSQYFIATVGIYDVWNVIKQGIQYVRDIDSALTELRKVTNETEASYAQFLQTASKTASMVGSTVSDFVNATADFARLGYDLNQASQLAEAASVYKNVGDGIDDISQASESIISTMKAFGIEANNAMGIVDRFNEVGKFIAQII